MASEKGFISPILLFISIVLIGIALGALFISRNYEFVFKKDKAVQPNTTRIVNNIDISLLFSLNKALVQDNNYDTYTPTTTQTYRSDTGLVNKASINIGYINEKEPKHKFYTSRSGKFLIRASDNSVQVAGEKNIESFSELINLPTGKILHTTFSGNEDRLVVTVEDSGVKIYIISINDKNQKMIITPPRPQDRHDVFGYDSVRNQVYWNRSEGPMTHYTEKVTIDELGNIKKIDRIKDFDFLTEFDSNFDYAYYRDYGSKDENYDWKLVRQSLKTNKKEALAQFPNETGIVHLKLSPTEDKLFFIDNFTSRKNDILYMFDLNTLQKESFLLVQSTYPEVKDYVSPDGRYLIFNTGISCPEGVCNDEEPGKVRLFDIEKKQLSIIYDSSKVPTQFGTTIVDEMESFRFLGWLATERN